MSRPPHRTVSHPTGGPRRRATTRSALALVTVLVAAVAPWGAARSLAATPEPAPPPSRAAGAAVAASEPTTSGPAVVPARDGVRPGQQVQLTITGFESRWVTISVCGNESRRGSADCDMKSSFNNEFDDAAMRLLFTVTEPPVDCPCVIRAVGREVSEVAIAPFEVVGHPVGDLVDPPVIGDLVAVGVTARPVGESAIGSLRASLGGPRRYEVTATVRNVSNVPLSQVRLVGSARRSGDDDLVRVDFDDPGFVAVGQTWQQTVVVDVPAPTFSAVTWVAEVSGAGPIVTGTETRRDRPWLLIVLVLVAAGSLALMLLRWVVRRRDERDAEHVPDGQASAVEPPLPAEAGVLVGGPSGP